MESQQKDTSTAQVTVEEYRYEKVKKTDVVVNIPQEPIFFHEWNHRTIVGLFPEFSDFKGGDGSVWKINIVEINEKSIERTSLNISSNELSDLISRYGLKNAKSTEDVLRDKVITYLKDFYTNDRVSRKVFDDKYNYFTRNLNKIIK